MGKRTRLKPEKACEGCAEIVTEMYRVRYHGQRDWVLLCKTCQMLAKTHTDYQYGGTWKQTKRNP